MAGTSEAVKKWVNKIIEENIIAVFAKTECPYCIKAISILKGYNLNSHMHVENIEKNPDMANIQAYLKELTGKSSVPRIFINKDVVGGCDDLVKENDEGKLKERLQKLGLVN
ncbi:glutaredoxin [Plasmodium falciparum Santa Lucia]|uniref:Glutaredoxin-1 n=8 Tax=Plasmodium falciparum TaxID=5833 RepID=Q9NLB2_PLAF7|nr:glutaredoxin 1 [Plasmodium falciparum 3D7]4HJM_A Chain A, Glutaredoxin [Plasmodium falciparum 3D7]4MZB_A Chain A, Glutaredoxin [Plasmodium falciparum 3D7]4MZC_A Chain A, Glutaredoxin [Plasmodium falciparum 3D7]4N0Z_A Chain A, Glutaredoxin [Plasmodium falciparum 3D7]4N10_A Chain A, Glutaredoxin [Plasmodium falciparum 3D7]4N11_A Chain A, Glutaredoxin [Plasmodium falciparum 3D7]7DIK_A Chain A, Glutaredoxin [Plasmodium falciparum 3D7]7DIL_A Chain A, Glutaredoxin-1 [Plasmodium falciparum]7DI|eukprot:XP_001351139.1 glutaredoxin 1 [Plasmodium falciparum 3D7]